jgi:hypothetical protein
LTVEKAAVGAAAAGCLLVAVLFGGCGALVLGFASYTKEEAPQPPPQLEADYRQVALEWGVDWELLAAWDGAENRFQLPVRPQQEIYEELVDGALEQERENAERLCQQNPGNPAFCPPPEPTLDPEERDQLAEMAYREWHGLVRRHIDGHASWVDEHRAEVDADPEGALRSVLAAERASLAVELYDGYVLLMGLDQIDDHVVEVPVSGPPPDWAPVDGFAWPAVGPITSRFGMRVSPIDGELRLHAGIDLGLESATPAQASKTGTVVRAEWDDVYGNVVVVDHGDGYRTLYAHNSWLVVSVGSTVTQGQVLGYSGSTGWSTGPHLHFEIHYHGSPVDPLLLLGR